MPIDMEQFKRDKAVVKKQASEKIAKLIGEVKDRLCEIKDLADVADIEVDMDDIGRAVREVSYESWNSSNC